MNYSTPFYPNLLLDKNRERQVVFYGRVSTEHEAQLSALENQLQWYDTQADEHKNWNIIGKYIDEGITGTQAKKRPAFLNMIEDAKKGKFDLIVTREVCRFARNTVDTLVATRELRNIGIEVYFVEDNIWTMDGDGELRLTIMATLAQEESRKVSERVRAGQQVSRENGMVYGCGNILGYKRSAGGTYEIDEEQAETVKLIFKMYTEDEFGSQRIARELERLGRKTALGYSNWHPEVVLATLKNPTYTGIQAYGKSFNNNYLEQKRIQNRDRSKYMYIKSNYEPIIPFEVFEKAQRIRESKKVITYSSDENGENILIEKTRKNPASVWARKIVDENGVHFRRQRWCEDKNGGEVYGYLKKMPKVREPDDERKSLGIPEWKFEQMGPVVVEYISDNVDSIASALLRSIETQKEKAEGAPSPLDIMIRIEKLESKLETLMEMRLGNEITPDEYKEMKAAAEKELRKYKAKDKAASRIVEIDIDALAGIKDKLISIIKESQSTEEMVEKAISKIVPRNRSLFEWFVKIDEGEIAIPVVAEGRTRHVTITIRDDWKNQI